MPRRDAGQGGAGHVTAALPAAGGARRLLNALGSGTAPAAAGGARRLLGALVRRVRPDRARAAGGLVLPAAHLRFCGAALKDDGAYLRSARREASRVLERMALPHGGRILDFGCGYGRLATGLLASGHSLAGYRGLDVSRDALRWCRKHLGGADRFTHVDARNERYNPGGAEPGADWRLPLPDAGFDLVYAYSVFSHLTQGDVRLYLRELRRVVLPGGRAFLTAFVEEGVAPVSVNPADYGLPWSGPLHCVRYERGCWEELVSRAGWTVEAVEAHAEMDGQSGYYLRA